MSAVPKLRFPEFDGEWQQRSLGQIAKLTSSKRVYLTDYTETGVPFFRGKEISELEKGIIPDDILFISNEAYERFKEKFGAPQAGDILITAVGTLANIFRVRDGQKFYFKDGNLIWLREIQQSSEFLEIYLKFSRPAILRSAIGSSQKALTIIALNKLDIKLPSLPEQQKIAAFLSSVDKKIDLLRQKKDALELYKKGLMQKVFSQEIRFKQDDGSDFPDWEELPFERIAERKSDRHKSGNANVLKIVELENIQSSQGSLTGEIQEKIPSLNNHIFQANDVLFGKLRPYLKKWFYAKFSGACSSEIWVLRARQGADSEFLYYLVQSEQFLTLTQMSSGSKMPRADWKVIAASEFQLPSLAEQVKISRLLAGIDQKISKLAAFSEQMETFKKGLLQQMFV